MSKLRSIDTSTWSDTWFESLSASEKLLFLYFITNDRTNMVGIYEISVRKISFETGIPQKDVEKHLKRFQKDGKIHYKSNHIILTNYLKHQKFNPNMKKAAIDCYNELPKSLKIEDKDILERSDKGFDMLRKGFGMVPKVEVEVESEDEDEKEDKGKRGFSPPTPTQVSSYAKEWKGIETDGEKFCDFYESKGWMVGKNKMKSWEAAVRNWFKDESKHVNTDTGELDPSKMTPEQKAGKTIKGVRYNSVGNPIIGVKTSDWK